jgi:hypothetical protein
VQSAVSTAVIGSASGLALPNPVAFAENGLTFVVVGTVAFSLVMSVLLLVTRGKDSMYDQIGQGGLTRESDFQAPAPQPDSPAALAEREREVRQMVRARSDRRVQRGEAPLDVDAEVTRLLSGAHADARSSDQRPDTALAEEVRQLVVARNERRARQGLDPLDVESEVQRTLAELDP